MVAEASISFEGTSGSRSLQRRFSVSREFDFREYLDIPTIVGTQADGE